MAKLKGFDTEESSNVSIVFFNKSYRYWLLLRKYLWLVFVLMFAGAVVQYYKIGHQPLRYISKGRMMVSARLSLPDGVSYSEELANFFGTQVEIMMSMEVIQGAKHYLKQEYPQLSGEVSLSANQVPKTSIFELKVVGTDPEYTRFFLDAVMGEFIEFKRDKRQETSFATIAQLTAELSRLKKEQEEQQKSIFDFKKQYNLAYWEAQGTAGTRYLSELKDQEARLKTKIKFLETLSLDQSTLMIQGESTSDRETTQTLGSEAAATSGLLEELPVNEVFRKEYFDTQKQLLKSQIILDDFSRVLKPEHPKIQAIQEETERLQNFLDLLLYRNLEVAQSNLHILKKQLETIQATIQESEESVLQSSQIQAEYELLRMALDRTKSSYASLLTHIQKLEINENVNLETIQILQKAEPALEAPRNWVLGILTGVFIGMLLGCGFIIVVDFFDDRIISSLDVEMSFEEPVLTQIPELRLENGLSDSASLLKAEGNPPPFSEAFRNLRSSILFRQENQQLKTLIICSSLPGEGKSSIAANLAITLSQTGEKILLIDGDLRRGNLSRLFEMQDKPGLSEAMADLRHWRNFIYPTAYPNLILFPLGDHPDQPGEFFLKAELSTFMTQAQNEFDRIIFDSAPLLAATDSASLAPKLDAVIMIVRSGLTSIQKLRQSMHILEARQANVFGLVINGIGEGTPGYGYYRYKNYYY